MNTYNKCNKYTSYKLANMYFVPIKRYLMKGIALLTVLIRGKIIFIKKNLIWAQVNKRKPYREYVQAIEFNPIEIKPSKACRSMRRWSMSSNHVLAMALQMLKLCQ